MMRSSEWAGTVNTNTMATGPLSQQLLPVGIFPKRSEHKSPQVLICGDISVDFGIVAFSQVGFMSFMVPLSLTSEAARMVVTITKSQESARNRGETTTITSAAGCTLATLEPGNFDVFAAWDESTPPPRRRWAARPRRWRCRC